MKWDNIYSGKWIKHFAWFPTNVNGETVWLQVFWERYVKIDGLSNPCGCGIVGKFERATDLPSKG